jgi:fatty acid desaturase
MARLFKVVGGLVIALAVVAAISILVIGGISGFFAALVTALLYAFWGAAIFAFGLMLEHLEAIRRDSARQSEMLTELIRKMPKPDHTPKASEANSLNQLTKSNFRFKDI